jgi:hypothetical protein
MKIDINEQNVLMVIPETIGEDAILHRWYMDHKHDIIKKCILFDRFPSMDFGTLRQIK